MPIARSLRRLPQKLLAKTVRLFSPSFTIGVTGIIFDEKGEVYVQKHRFWPDQKWGFPGGFLKHGETPEEGLEREIHEESGLKVTVGPMLAMEAASKNHFNICYLATLTDKSQAKIQRFEVMDARWVPLDQLPTPFLNAHQTFIKNHKINLPKK